MVKNLGGVFTGQGVVQKQGRRPTLADLGFVAGPVDLAVAPDGKIETVGRLAASSNDRVFDGTGLVATAGFKDSHTHALYMGSRSPEFFMRWSGKSYREISDAGGGIHNSVAALATASDTDILRAISAKLGAMAQWGSTRVEVKSGYGRDASSELRFLRLLKQARSQKHQPHISATFLGLHALPKDRSESDFVDEMIGALPIIRKEQLAEFVDAFPEQGFFSLEESLRFGRAAHDCGLRLKVHADEITDMGAASAFARLGAQSVDHLQKIHPSAVALLAHQNTVATFLPATSFFLGIEYAPARAVIDAGARFALASDYNPGTAPAPGFGLTMFLAASQLRLTAPEIVSGVTYGGAAALGVEQQEGALLPGFFGDFLLWNQTSLRPEPFLQDLIVAQMPPKFVFIRGQALPFSGLLTT